MKIEINLPDPPFKKGDRGMVTEDWRVRGWTGIVKDVYFHEARFNFDENEVLYLKQGYWVAIVTYDNGGEGHHSANQFEVIE